jgi:DNA-binding Xre family transcriptional regulator
VQGVFVAPIEGKAPLPYLETSCRQRLFSVLRTLDIEKCVTYDARMITCMLKRVLERKGWSRYRLQKETGISFPTLHALYHSRSRGYSSDVLDRLCRALRCQPGDLLRRTSRSPHGGTRRGRRV